MIPPTDNLTKYKYNLTLKSAIVHNVGSAKNGNYFTYIFTGQKVYKYDNIDGVPSLLTNDVTKMPLLDLMMLETMSYILFYQFTREIRG